MKTVYLSGDYKCHIQNGGDMIAVETDAFDGKCDAYIDGYRLIPDGYSWVRDDGEVFEGEMISPCVDYNLLLEFQSQYESAFHEMEQAYRDGVDSL